jgi:hypothetical protein
MKTVHWNISLFKKTHYFCVYIRSIEGKQKGAMVAPDHAETPPYLRDSRKYNHGYFAHRLGAL